MIKKPGDLAAFQVNKKPAPAANATEEQPPQDKPPLITKGFQVTPGAAQQFDMLKAEMGPGKGKGPELIAEALNMLFEKYGKPPVA